MNVLVVDDQALNYEVLRNILAGSKPVGDIETSTSSPRISDCDGVSAHAEVRDPYAIISIIVLMARQDTAKKAHEHGPGGAFQKSANGEIDLSAKLAGSTNNIPPNVLSQTERELFAGNGLAHKSPSEIGLTARQADVLALILQGKSNKSICRLLDLAEPTVKNHVTAILRDRHGKLRRYYKRKGQKGIALLGEPGSAEFMAAYHAAEAGIANPEIGASRTSPCTISALCVLYYKSSEFTTLTEDTQKRRRKTIEAFRLKNGHKSATTIRTDDIRRMMWLIENIYERRVWFKAIRALFKAAVPSMRSDNPTDDIPSVKLPKTDGHTPWSDEEIQQYRDHWKLGTQQRLVFEFALEALSRRCEVVRFGPQHVKNDRIRIERAKGSKDVDILLTPDLKAAIDAMPKAQMVYITNDSGKPRSAASLGNNFAKWATKAGLPSHCRLHGLKKSGMNRLVDAGATAHELMAVSGHRTLAQAQHYTEGFDRKKAADQAIKKRIANK